MGPDEYHDFVNDSAYTNAGVMQASEDCSDKREWSCYKLGGNVSVAQALSFAASAASTLGLNSTVTESWLAAAAAIVVPFDAERQYHPEYDGYVFGTKVKQADTILLGFPLAFSHPTFTPSTLANDLAAYGNCTDAGGPAMTWGMFAVGYIQLGPAYALLAASNFNRSFANAQVSLPRHHQRAMLPRCWLTRRSPSMCGPRRRRAARPTS